SGSRDTTILVWDLAGLKVVPGPAAVELQPPEVESLWTDLVGDDAGKAFRGILRLAAAPRQAVPFLGERLRPAAPAEARVVEGLVADLDGDKFQVRQKALSGLEQLGDLAVPILQKVLASKPSLEISRRVEPLLAKLTRGTLTAEQVRLVRAVEVLEKVGTPEAVRGLETLAGGGPGGRAAGAGAGRPGARGRAGRAAASLIQGPADGVRFLPLAPKAWATVLLERGGGSSAP